MRSNKNKEQPIKQDLKTSFPSFFKDRVAPEWFPLIKMYLTKLTFKRSERIFNQGDKVKGVYIIQKGKVKVVSLYEKGNERILRLANDGKFLGHRALSFESYPVSAIALTDTSVYFIPIEIFISLLKGNPNFSIFMINFIAAELNESEVRMKNMIHNDIKMRIADIICMLIDAFGFDEKEKFKLAFTLSRKDIANIAGTTYETVIRMLVQLEKMKLIGLKGKEIIVKREFDLRKLAGKKL